MNVLITSASRKVGLVRAFQSALAQCGGGHVIAVDVHPFAPALYIADSFALVPPSADPQFIDEILRLCRDHRIRLIVPTRDEELPLFSGAAENLKNHDIFVMVPAPETVRICQDKLAFVHFCQEHHFHTPKTFEGEEWNKAVFPLFVKPRFGKSGRGTTTVRSLSELRAHINDSSDCVIQEHVSHPEYSVDLFADFAGRVISVVPRLRQLVLAGESQVSQTVADKTLIDESVRLAAELHLVGHNTIQCFYDGSAVSYIEVNPRFGGASTLSFVAGADSPQMLIRLINGETVPEVSGFERDLVMLRYSDDLFLQRRDLAQAFPPRSFARKKHSEVSSGQRFQTVLFDLDNTLYAEEEFVRGGLRSVATYLAKDQKLDSEMLFRKMLLLLESEGRAQIFNKLLQTLGLETERLLKTLLFVYRTHRPAIHLFPGTEQLLLSLKRHGTRVGIVTDGLASIQRKKIDALKLNHLTDAIVCTGELGEDCAKPSVIPFEIALSILDTSPALAAYIADDVEKDFAGPNRLGVTSIQIQSPGLVGVPRQSGACDHIFQPQLKVPTLTDALIELGLIAC